MNIQTADECRTKFDEIKFRKVEARYIVYQILNEKIVPLDLFRSLKGSVPKTKLGTISSLPSPKKSTDTASLISSSSTRTKWQSAKWFS